MRFRSLVSLVCLYDVQVPYLPASLSVVNGRFQFFARPRPLQHSRERHSPRFPFSLPPEKKLKCTELARVLRYKTKEEKN